MNLYDEHDNITERLRLVRLYVIRLKLVTVKYQIRLMVIGDYDDYLVR